MYSVILLHSFSIFNLQFSIYHLAAHVWNKCFGYADAFLCLVVLQDGCHDAGQGEGRAIEGVAEFRLACCCATDTALQTVCLISVEVRDGADLEPTLLGFAIDLEVVANGTGEALVAAAKT